MTKAKALTQAKEESTLYRQGRGWIVSTFDTHANAWRASLEMPWAQATQVLSTWRVARAAELVLNVKAAFAPINPDRVDVAAFVENTSGAIPVRLAAVVAHFEQTRRLFVRCDHCGEMFKTDDPHDRWCSDECKAYCYQERN